MTPNDPILETMISAARAGGTEVRRYFRQELDIRVKSRTADVVTQADIASESAILEQLKAAFPTAGIRSEEAGVIESHKSNEWFIIDPLDGTHNFSLGLPMCGVMIARMQPWGTLTHGVIYEPIVDATYAASVGQGAWHVETGAQLTTSVTTTLADSTIHYSCGYQIAQLDPSAIDRAIGGLRSVTSRLTLSWASACDLPVFARGLSEGLIFDRAELHDMAAVVLIAREAGAVILRFDGQPAIDTNDQIIIAANQPIADALLRVVGSRP